MIYFSEKQQSFYDSNLTYTEQPDDLVSITEEQHSEALEKINDGHYAFSDMTYSTQKPTPYHVWQDQKWQDLRTDAEKRQQFLQTLTPLTQRQFKLILLKYDLLTAIEQQISAIKDTKTQAQIKIEYDYATTFERESETVAYMSGLIGLSSDQVDSMWQQAMAL